MPENSGSQIPNSRLPILVGPTGVGKSEVAYHLALRAGAEIISADAFQVYRGLEIGTAQPSKEWQRRVPHHLIGSREPSDNWNAVEFARAVKEILQKAGSAGKKKLLVGGSGFYLKALIVGAPAGASPDPEIRAMVSEKAAELGNLGLHGWLKSRDPAAAERLHPNDAQRVCRALEKTFKAQEAAADYEPLGEGNVSFFGLERSRDNLDRILRERSRIIWNGGLLSETQKLIDLRLPVDHPLWGAIGYLEAAAHIRGKMKEDEAIERIFRRTRQYAKRQWTWFKHQHRVEWIDLDDFPNTLQVVDELEKRMDL